MSTYLESLAHALKASSWRLTRLILETKSGQDEVKIERNVNSPYLLTTLILGMIFSKDV